MTFRLHDLADRIEQTLHTYRPLPVPAAWGAELIFPHYGGLSLRNVPHSIAALLGAPLPGSAPLDEQVWGGERPDIQFDRVIAFLMDGMGYRHVQRLAAEDAEAHALLADLTDGRGPVPLTSVLPSTTAVALTTLWTGAAPAATGITGTFTYLRPWSMIGDMLRFAPVPGGSPADTFVQWGVKAEEFVPVPGVAEQLAAQGVTTHLLLAHNLSGTGLSRILHRGIAQRHTHMGYSDFPLRLHHLLRQTAGQRGYIGVYHPGLDTLAHAYGAHNAFTAGEIKTYLRHLRDMLADPAVRDGRTLFMLLADHGHYDAPQPINLKDDPPAAPLRDALHMSLTGDERLANAYLRPGTLERVTATLAEHYADRLTWLETEAALAAGVYGPAVPEAHRHRLGDLVLIPRLGWKLRDPVLPPLPLVSVHSGMDAWEMLIPFLWQAL
ncbi:MAG: alkaline phosphatase family protein [Anaerolineae bacterium]|nr:alkaline phosphatase family protein [Anaerolineae bacterium]